MLEARDIVFSYPGGRALYDGFSLSVGPGERVALVSPSGTGKTTLCRILAGYLRPDSGEVLVDGSPLPKRGVCPVQMVGQHPENMVDARMRMKAVLEEAGPLRDALCDGLGIRSEWLSRHPHELSGGELQRFCIARALSADPRYLICDETTAMFDALTQAEVWRFLMGYAADRGMGMLLVSHSPALLSRVATRTVRLKNGM